MIEPSKYKSILTKEIKNKTVTPLTGVQKVQTRSILQKLMELIKQKHA